MLALIPTRIDILGEPKALWFVNRASGLVLLVLLTVVLVLGAMTSRQRAGGRVPRFATNEAHRSLALTAAAFLVIHVATGVLDDFVSIDLIHAFVPWGAGWQPLWIGLGALAVDILIAVFLTSWFRDRMPERAWRSIHLLVYAMWPIAWLHALGAGTDAKNPAYLAVSIVCAIAVVASGVLRFVRPAPVPEAPVDSSSRRRSL